MYFTVFFFRRNLSPPKLTEFTHIEPLFFPMNGSSFSLQDLHSNFLSEKDNAKVNEFLYSVSKTEVSELRFSRFVISTVLFN